MTPDQSIERSELPEQKKQKLEDNARKFTLNSLEYSFLQAWDATSYSMTTDWLETNEDTEKKVVLKEYPSGVIKTILISKAMVDGDRTSEKEDISREQYAELAETAELHLQKTRYEFDYVQHGITFHIKYDEFAHSDLRVLEVDADTEDQRTSFDVTAFPAGLTETTGNLDYYGYRIASIV
jgi:hypothetical protein